MSKSSTLSTANIREELCRRIAHALNGGTNHVRVRIHQQSNQPIGAHLLFHQKNQWHQAPADLVSAEGLPLLVADMTLLASQAHTDELAIRQVSSAEAIDTDLQFRNDWVEQHRGDHLASFVEGVLFGEAHGSGKEARRQIRGPHSGA